jgi:signal transduction histidine kinase
LRKFHEQMERADRLAALGTFAAGMAHEVRNPLASMKGMVQLLAESADPEQQSEYVRRLDSEIARLESLMSEVLEFAQPEPARPRPTDLNRVVRESLDVASERHQPEARQVSVRLELDPALPPGVVEIRRLHQAIVNLILNAFEAAPDGSEVVIRTRAPPTKIHRSGRCSLRFPTPARPFLPRSANAFSSRFTRRNPKAPALGCQSRIRLSQPTAAIWNLDARAA